MTDTKYTIFFSWQSDLPNSETRGLIQSSIDSAIKGLKDTISIEADRDTKGMFGSPDMVQAILNKIDECDVFIADVSPVTTYRPIGKDGKPSKRIKATPNPNVLFELGYAAQIVGWNNIICIMNEDYNQGEIPFDIDHHRLTKYSLEGKEKADVRRELKDIISSTVLNVMENGKRPKSNFSNIKVGSYNMKESRIDSTFSPLNLQKISSVQKAIASLKDEAEQLLEDILAISLPEVVESEIDVLPKKISITDTYDDQSNEKEPIPEVYFDIIDNFLKPHPVKINQNDRKEIRGTIKELFNREIPDSFFTFGGLKKKTVPGIKPTYELEGSIDEKQKYYKYIGFEGILERIDLWEMFLKTFNEYALIQLAVSNESSVSDNQIKIYVEIVSETANTVCPSEDIIYPELKELEDWVYEEGLIKNTLQMESNTDISYDTDLSSFFYDYQHIITEKPYDPINDSPRYDKEDYARELSKFIATPLEGNPCSYCFEIGSLQAKEKKWLSGIIMVTPQSNTIKLKYTIKSNNSDGTLGGTLLVK